MTTMRKVSAVALVCLIGCVGYQKYQEVAGSSKPAGVVVVVESSAVNALTQAQIAWLQSPKLRADLKAAKIAFARIDPDVKDKSGNTPAAYVPILARVKSKLPRVVLIGPRGGLTDHPLPADEAAARKLFGMGGTP
jgi:hypothetical protein